MSVSSKCSDDGRDMVICVSGRFDFSDHKDFRDAYKGAANDAQFKLDLSGTEYMDSSALGMLLLLREHAGGDTCKIEITGCSEDIRKILQLSNFNQMFEIT